MRTDTRELLDQAVADAWSAAARIEQDGLDRASARGSDGTSSPASLTDLFSQATELSQHFTEIYDSKDVRKRRDLRERAGRQPRKRTVLTDLDARRKKLAIESGYDIRRHAFLAAPLEPWTCPVNAGGRMYAEIMLGDPGATTLGDYSGDRLAALEWMRGEELVMVDDDGRIQPLSDGAPRDRRAYPGALVSDAKAKIGRQLRHRAVGLVLAAFVNITRRCTVARISPHKRRHMERHNGIAITAYDLAREANAIKAKRRDLDEFRYLSLSRCRDIVRELVKTGQLAEAEPPKAVRRDRSWFTLPRVFENPEQPNRDAKPGKRLKPDHQEVLFER